MLNAPIQRSTSLRYLIRDLLRAPRFRALQRCGQGDLVAGLQPVAALAAWICKFQPELADKSSLHVAVVGAEHEDTVDEGRWYGFLGYLLGNETLHTRVTFVGPSLYRFSGTAPAPTRDGVWNTDAARVLAEIGFQKAKIHKVDAGAFAGLSEADTVDLIVLFNPGLEDDQQYSWFEQGQLSALCSLGKPLALTAYAEEEQLQEAYLLKAWGFSTHSETAINPFVIETPVGAWSKVLWALHAKPVDANHRPDQKMLERHDRFLRVAHNVLAETGMPFPEATGKIVPIRVQAQNPAADSQAILLPATKGEGGQFRLGVGVPSGLLYSVRDSIAALAPEMSERVVPPELLEMYDRNAPFAFEHILWAIDTTDWLSRRNREAANNAALAGMDNFDGLDLAQLNRQVEALKRDKSLMAAPQAQGLADMMGAFAELVGGLPDDLQAMLKQGTSALPARKAFEATKGAEAFFHALESGQWTRVYDLLQQRPEFAHALNREGANAAMYAASANNLELLAQLAQAGTDFNVQDNELFAPLHEAARRGFPEAVHFLLTHGAHPDPVSRYGWTPLLMTFGGRMGSAPASAYSQIVLTLLEHKADARRKNMAGMSAGALADAVELSEAARRALKVALT